MTVKMAFLNFRKSAVEACSKVSGYIFHTNFGIFSPQAQRWLICYLYGPSGILPPYNASFLGSGLRQVCVGAVVKERKYVCFCAVQVVLLPLVLILFFPLEVWSILCFLFELYSFK